MGRARTIWTATLAVALGLAAIARADRVELRTGDVFSGTILRVTEDSVSIQLESGGILSFRLSGVQVIQRRIPGTETSETLLDRGGKADGIGEPHSTSIQPLLSPSAPDHDPPLEDPPDDTSSPPRDAPTPSAPATAAASGGPGATASDKPMLAPRVAVAKHGISLAPPRGFTPWEDARSPKIPLAFHNPRNNSTFIVEWRVSTSPLEEVKNQSLREYSERYRVFHVVRDVALTPETTEGVAPDVWLLEVESQVGILTIRQVQAFYKLKSEVFVLTYSGTSAGFDARRPSIEASLQSFRFDGAMELEAPEKAWQEPARRSDEPPLGY